MDSKFNAQSKYWRISNPAKRGKPGTLGRASIVLGLLRIARMILRRNRKLLLVLSGFGAVFTVANYYQMWKREDAYTGIKRAPTVTERAVIGQRSLTQPHSRAKISGNISNRTNSPNGSESRPPNKTERRTKNGTARLAIIDDKETTGLNSSQNITTPNAKDETFYEPFNEQHEGVSLTGKASDGKLDVDGISKETDEIRNIRFLLQKTNPLHSDRIINPHPFRILKHPSACGQHAPEGKVFLLILVACRPEEDKDRRWIRDTWGGIKVYRGKHILTRFLVGWPLKKVYAGRLDQESALYDDIVQEEFIDTYRTMTHKVLMGLKWAAQMCPNASYVMNVDSDMFVNVFRLVRRLEEAPRGNFAEGNLKVATKPKREFLSKWYTPLGMYPESTYPPYLNGPAYVMSGDLPGRIFNESAHVRYLPWDDVYVGIVMKKLGVQLQGSYEYEDYHDLWDGATMLKLISIGMASCVGHQRQPDFVLRDIWVKLLKQQENYLYLPPSDSQFWFIARNASLRYP